MRFFELFEAPINNYDTIGDFSKNSSFRDPRDRKLITSPNSIKRTKKKFENTEYDINMLFINSPKANKHTEVGKVSPEWVRENLGDEAYEKVMQYLEDDAINVIFTNNKGSQRVAMTSWIIAHRIGHALSRNDVGFVTRRQIQSYEESEKIIIEYFTEILKDGYGFPRKYNNSSSLRSDRLTQLGMIKLGQAVCTFRSAREKNLRDWFEITNELFAQFLTTSNGIQFNSLPEFIQVGKSKYRLTTDKIMADELAYRLQNQISTLEIYFDSIMTESHNAIFVM